MNQSSQPPSSPSSSNPPAGREVTVRVQRFAELTLEVAYAVWALRSEVFVVEQDCPYLDLDGRDLELGTWHVWCPDPEGAGRQWRRGSPRR